MESANSNPPAPIDILGTVSRFLKVFSKLWVLILIFALFFGAKDFFSGQASYTPMYECQCLFSVGSEHSSSDIFSSDAFYSDTAAAQTMVKTFPTLLSMEYMRDLIIAQLDKDYINGTITSSSIEDTNLVLLKVTSSDPQDAYDILNAVLAAYPQAAVYLVNNPAIQIRNAPEVPTEPINRLSPQRSWFAGAVKGTILGFAAIIGLTLLNQTVSNTEELKKIVNLPILGKLPLVTQRKRRKAAPTLVSLEANPALAEAMRSLRTKARKAVDQTGGNVILLTSTIPGEGKTTVSCNLALSLAEAGHSVVLLDADLRKQSILKIFQPKAVGGKGLLYALHNPNAALSEIIRQLPNSPLHYVSGGSIQRRHYGLDPKALNRIISQLSEVYDYVVVDTPPCSVVSDTRILCKYADCVLYVVKTDGAHKMLVSDSIASLHQQGITVTGCIVNGVPRRQTRYGYDYSKKYGKS